jgi:hypothetical protein
MRKIFCQRLHYRRRPDDAPPLGCLHSAVCTPLVHTLDYLANITYIDNDSYSQSMNGIMHDLSTAKRGWNCYPSQIPGQRHAIPQLLRHSPDEIGTHTTKNTPGK